MTERPASPANANDAYDHRLNGHPIAAPWRDVQPLPVLDPDIEAELRAAALAGDDRRWVAVGDLTPQEIEAMTTSRIETGEPYDLADIAEDGTMLGGKRGPHG